jgi:curved DNA-binding protein CbpA
VAVPADDLYGTLGVPAEATQAEITHAYRRRVRNLHPDLNPKLAEAEASLAEVLAAYAVLGNATRRADYDRERARLAHAKSAAARRRESPAHEPGARERAAREWARAQALGLLALHEQALRENALREQAMRDQERRGPGQADEWPRRAEPPLRAGPIRVVRRPPGAGFH